MAWIIGVLLIVVVLYLVGIYNRLVVMRNSAKNAFAQIDVQLGRRHDLVPNLVEVAKGYLQHERSTLEAVIQAVFFRFPKGQKPAAAFRVVKHQQ